MTGAQKITLSLFGIAAACAAVVGTIVAIDASTNYNEIHIDCIDQNITYSENIDLTKIEIYKTPKWRWIIKDKKTVVVESEYVTYNPETIGKQNAVVTYGGKTTTFELTINPKRLETPAATIGAGQFANTYTINVVAVDHADYYSADVLQYIGNNYTTNTVTINGTLSKQVSIEESCTKLVVKVTAKSNSNHYADSEVYTIEKEI